MVTVTHRKPCKSHPLGAVQGRCYHHAAEERANPNGKQYLLPCRKEFRIDRGGTGADDDAVQRCIAWLLRASLYPTRVGPHGHQKGDHSDRVFDVDPLQEIVWQCAGPDIAGEQGEADGPLVQAAPPLKVLAAQSVASSGSSTSSSSTSTSTSSNMSSTPPAAPAELQRCCCGADHPGMSCAAWQAILEASMRQPHSVPGPAFQGTAPHRGRCVLHGIALRDVPGDGDCMFHAFSAELARCYGASFAAEGQLVGFVLIGCYDDFRFLALHQSGATTIPDPRC